MNAIISCLLDLELGPIVFNQVVDVVHVKLYKANPDCKLFRLHFLLYWTKYVKDCPMEVPSTIAWVLAAFTAKYSVSFACACLAIC